MYILRYTDDNLDADTRSTLRDIYELAKKTTCHSEDMEYADGRADLMRLPVSLLPQPARDIDRLFHEKMGAFVYNWADEKGFRLKGQRHHRPQIVWLQGGGLSTGHDLVSISMIIPRPKPRSPHQGEQLAIANVNVTEREEISCTGVIKSPIGGSLFVESRFACCVGDVILLEGGEKLLVSLPVDSDIGARRDICILVTSHLRSPKEGEAVRLGA